MVPSLPARRPCSHTGKGVSWGPEKTGPVTGWLVRDQGVAAPPLRTLQVLSPICHSPKPAPPGRPPPGPGRIPAATVGPVQRVNGPGQGGGRSGWRSGGGPISPPSTMSGRREDRNGQPGRHGSPFAQRRGKERCPEGPASTPGGGGAGGPAAPGCKGGGLSCTIGRSLVPAGHGWLIPGGVVTAGFGFCTCASASWIPLTDPIKHSRPGGGVGAPGVKAVEPGCDQGWRAHRRRCPSPPVVGAVPRARPPPGQSAWGSLPSIRNTSAPPTLATTRKRGDSMRPSGIPNPGSCVRSGLGSARWWRPPGVPSQEGDGAVPATMGPMFQRRFSAPYT